MQIVDGDPVELLDSHSVRRKLVVCADYDLVLVAPQLDDIKRCAGSNAQALALSNREIVNAGVLADHFAGCGDQLARGIGQSLALFIEICINKALVIPTRNKADLDEQGE